MNRLTLHRLLLWAVLLIFAAWFLTPLYVMVVTSLKDAEQLRMGNLLSLPTAPTLDAWSKAWSSACTGEIRMVRRTTTCSAATGCRKRQLKSQDPTTRTTQSGSSRGF